MPASEQIIGIRRIFNMNDRPSDLFLISKKSHLSTRGDLTIFSMNLISYWRKINLRNRDQSSCAPLPGE